MKREENNLLFSYYVYLKININVDGQNFITKCILVAFKHSNVS